MENNKDELKWQIQEMLQNAYSEFADYSQGFWQHGEMKWDGVVADRIMEKIDEYILTEKDIKDLKFFRYGLITGLIMGLALFVLS